MNNGSLVDAQPPAFARRSQFGLWQMFYTVTLLSAGYSIGIVAGTIAVLGLLVWFAFFWLVWNQRPPVWFFALVLIWAGAVFFVSKKSTSRIGFAKMQTCHGNLVAIKNALESYAIANGRYPPPFTTDENGNPKHSWRALILPYLDPSLASRYDYSQSWDNSVNREIRPRGNSRYCCPSCKACQTDLAFTPYKMVTGKGTIFNGQDWNFQTLPRDVGKTVVIVEDHQNPIFWSQPEDLTIEEASAVLSLNSFQHSSPHRNRSSFRTTQLGLNVLKINGVVMRIGPGQPKSNLQEAMTIGKSSSVTLTSEPVVTKNYQQIIALVTMIVMLVLPLFYLPRHMDIAALEQIRYLNQLELLKREAASLAKKPQELQEASVE